MATKGLEAGDALRRFKAEVSQDEPRRGNSTNRRTGSTSIRCLEIVTVYGILLTCVGVLVFFYGTCVCIYVYWCEVLFLRCFVLLCKERCRYLRASS